MSLTYEAPAASQLASAAALLTRFRAVRQATTDLCRPLSPEDMMVQSCAEASPAKWHLAHTSWFFETFVLTRLRSLATSTFNPDFSLALQLLLQLTGRHALEKKLRSQQLLPSRRSIEIARLPRARRQRPSRLAMLRGKSRRSNEDEVLRPHHAWPGA